MKKLHPPWDLEVIQRLWERQQIGHPYTCLYHGTAALIPTYNGWVCPENNCDYTQDWCHLMDAAPPEPQPLLDNRQTTD